MTLCVYWVIVCLTASCIKKQNNKNFVTEEQILQISIVRPCYTVF